MNPTFVVRALVGNIDSVDASLGKVFAPHSQGATAGFRIVVTTDADFDQGDGFFSKGREMRLVMLTVPMLAPFVSPINLDKPAEVATIQEREGFGETLAQGHSFL